MRREVYTRNDCHPDPLPQGIAMIQVLLVDSDPSAREMAGARLGEEPDLILETSTSPEEALALLRSERFDVIVAEEDLPGMDGLAFFRSVRGSGDHVPLILFTGQGSPELLCRAMDAEADFYLEKGPNPHVQYTLLVHLIRRAVRRARMDREEHEFSRFSLDHVSEGILWTDGRGTILSVNRAAPRLLSREEKGLLGVKVQEVLPVLSGFFAGAGSGDPVIHETLVTDDTRNTFPAILKLHTLHHRGTPYHCLILRDMSARRVADQHVHALKEFYEGILENAHDGIWVTDADDVIYYLNPALERMIGHPRASLLERNFLREAGSARMEALLPFYEDARKHMRTVAFDSVPVTDAAGVPLFVSGWFTPVRDPGGHYDGMIASAHDVTDRKMTGDAYQLANRKLHLMSSVTRHDILNQLMVLRSYLEMGEEMAKDPELRGFIGKERAAAEAIQRLIGFTRDYQEIGVHAPLWQRVGEILARVRSMVDVHDVSLEGDMGNLEVFADPLLEKVFYNLIDNAIRHGGTLTWIRFSAQRDGQDLLITCEDNGIGVPPHEKERIFGHGAGKNMGFGLFLVREILSINGISIRENGQPGRGARFEIRVPPGSYRYRGERGGSAVAAAGQSRTRSLPGR
ncbi:MAG: PAS domain S-box protein [Methanomicrobiales archaeon]|nr:PAS domain S-box protein [Methanomicrobiales archaeon]